MEKVKRGRRRIALVLCVEPARPWTAPLADAPRAGGAAQPRLLRHRKRANDRAEFRKFVDLVEANVPADLDIHIVMDNYGTHKTKAKGNQRSTWFSQEALVGVKWACQRGRLANQSRIALVLWVP